MKLATVLDMISQTEIQQFSCKTSANEKAWQQDITQKSQCYLALQCCKIVTNRT